jgi:hypothetical protein
MTRGQELQRCCGTVPPSRLVGGIEVIHWVGSGEAAHAGRSPVSSWSIGCQSFAGCAAPTPPPQQPLEPSRWDADANPRRRLSAVNSQLRPLPTRPTRDRDGAVGTAREPEDSFTTKRTLRKDPAAGAATAGLPCAANTAVPRHLAVFLWSHALWRFELIGNRILQVQATTPNWDFSCWILDLCGPASACLSSTPGHNHSPNSGSSRNLHLPVGPWFTAQQGKRKQTSNLEGKHERRGLEKDGKHCPSFLSCCLGECSRLSLSLLT